MCQAILKIRFVPGRTLRRGSIDRVVQATEMRATGFELLDDREKVAD
jgi:hypothetical protein